MLLQACEKIDPSLKSSLGTASYLPLLQVLRRYDYPIPACSSEESFDSIMRGVKTETTIRQMMHEFYKKFSNECLKENLVKFKGFEKEAVTEFNRQFSFHAKVGDTVTVYDPLEVRPVGKINLELPSRPLLPGYKEVGIKELYSDMPYESYQARKHYDWVFSVRNIDDLRNGRFFCSTESPGDYMWRTGIINLGDILSRSYRNILPKG